MKPQTLYRYSVLRYVHDVRTEEFLNVGVLFQSPEAGLLKFRRIEKTGRLSGAFPGIEPQSVIQSLAKMADEFGRIAELARESAIEDLRHAVLPKDDSSFQWAPTAGGVSDALDDALESVFQRHIGRYERKYTKRIRHDYDVWETMRAELEKRHVLAHLHTSKISTPLRSYEFQHSWQNHQLHAIKPLSLDGLNGDEIADKASRYVGVMRDLQRSSEQFQLHLIVGHSLHSELEGSFASARDLLRECADGERAIVHEEAEVPQLADQIQRDVASSGGMAT